MSARARLVACAIAAVSCSPEIPQGRIACQSSEECPNGWSCEDGRCYATVQAFDAGTDAGLVEVFPEDASATDAHMEDVAPPPVDAGPEDSGPDLMPPDSCQPEEPDHSAGVFVSPVGRLENNCGSADLPCATIALGLARAAVLERPFVYLDHGQYEEEVVLPAGVTLLGGWDNIGGRWTRHCGASPERLASIVSPTSVAVRAQYDGQATLERLTIRHGGSAPGESRYGVFARGAGVHLILRRVIVIAADGGDGATPAPGEMPAAPSESCEVGDGAPAGADGAKGESAGAGAFTADGFVPGHGQVGELGLPGHAGAARVASCGTCVVSGTCTAGTRLTCTGKATGVKSCPTVGAPGCGGLPGPGGNGGTGGGASVALFAWQAHVELYDSLLRSGDGGAGALGALGGPGGPASAPGAGSPGESCVRCQLGKLSPFPTACSETTSGVAAVSGSPGTPGSSGGPGGDGAGGSSYAVFRGAGAELETENTQFEHGEPGSSQGAGATGIATSVSPAQ